MHPHAQFYVALGLEAGTKHTTSDVFPGLDFDKLGAIGGTAREQTAYLAIAGSHAPSGGDILL